MTANVPEFVESKYFESEPVWHLSDDAPSKLKREIEEYMNSIVYKLKYKRENPEMVEPYMKWNGKIVDKFHGDDGDDEQEESATENAKGGHGNTRLPYGLAKGEGIDTTGMEPKDVWAALEGKGYSAEESYRGLKEGKSGKELKTSTKEEPKPAKSVGYELDNIMRPDAPKEERQAKLTELKGEISEKRAKAMEILSRYGDSMTEKQAKEFTLVKHEYNELMFEHDNLLKPLSEEKIKELGKSVTALNSEEIAAARNDLLKSKEVFVAVADAADGVYIDSDTPIDSLYKKDPEKLYHTFDRTREMLHKKYGDTVKLYRVGTSAKAKTTINMTSTRENAEQYAREYGGKVSEAEVPVDDVLLVNVSRNGGYEEFVVLNKEGKITEAVKGPEKVEDVPNEHVKKSTMSDVKLPDSQSKSVLSIIKRTSSLKKEQYRIVGADGKILVESKGDKGSVGTTIGQKREAFWNNKGAVSIHNHPDGGTFSSSDFSDFGHGASAIFATTKDGTYVLKKKDPDKTPKWIELRDGMEKECPHDMSYIDLRKKAEQSDSVKKAQEKYNQISTDLYAKWKKRKDEGASDDELREIANDPEWESSKQALKDALHKEIRRLETEPNDEFLKKNADKLGFEYYFIPNGKKMDSSDSRLDELDSIERFYIRRAMRKQTRMDAEEEGEGNKPTGGHGNTKLPYGLAKGEGIDTKNMSPKEVWKALEGKGYSAEESYKGLKEGKHGKDLKAKKSPTIKTTIKHDGTIDDNPVTDFKNPYVSQESRGLIKKSAQQWVRAGEMKYSWYDHRSFDIAGINVRNEIIDRYKLRKKNKDIGDSFGKPQIEDIYDVLKDAREFGASDDFMKNKIAVSSPFEEERTNKIVNCALSRFPKEWLDSCGNGVSITIHNSSGRSCFLSYDNQVHIYVKESPEVIKMLGGKISEDKCDNAIVSELTHELGHYVENNNEKLNCILRNCLEQRTKGCEEESMGDTYPTKRDSFFDEYMGKQYPSGDTEILSTLMQKLGNCDPLDVISGKSAFSTTKDTKSLKFILGMLVGG